MASGPALYHGGELHLYLGRREKLSIGGQLMGKSIIGIRPQMRYSILKILIGKGGRLLHLGGLIQQKDAVLPQIIHGAGSPLSLIHI